MNDSWKRRGLVLALAYLIGVRVEVSAGEQSGGLLLTTDQMGERGLCVIGCTPYVDLRREDTGLAKYRALVEDMAQTCDIIVHVGDTKAGELPCNHTYMKKSIAILRGVARRTRRIALYTLGDNEALDCYKNAHQASDFVKAADARGHIVTTFRPDLPQDLTRRYSVDSHQYSDPNALVPGTASQYSCDFDKYVALSNYAVVTLEIPGSWWYLADNRAKGYHNQDHDDPLEHRLGLYLNAMGCAMEWIEQSAAKASNTGKKAVFFLFHALFYSSTADDAADGSGIGDYYNTTNLQQITQTLTGKAIAKPFDPLFEKFTSIALNYPQLQFYAIHSDGHRTSTLRLNPELANRVVDDQGTIVKQSNHNFKVHMVEGQGRALTIYSRFLVDNSSFQPVTHREEWSLGAYYEQPVGHTIDPRIPL